MLLAGYVGFQYFSSNDVPTNEKPEVGFIQQVISGANAMLSTGAGSIQAAKDAVRTLESVKAEGERALTQSSLGSGLSLPVAAPGCGEPDEHGNLKYCFNRRQQRL
jgi:hypothetical protein